MKRLMSHCEEDEMGFEICIGLLTDITAGVQSLESYRREEGNDLDRLSNPSGTWNFVRG